MSILHNSKALDIGYFACRFGEWRHLPVAPARSVEPLKMRRWLPNVAPCPDRLPRQDCSPRHAHALPLGQPPLAYLRCIALVGPKIGRSAARWALARGTSRPTSGPARHIVPTYLLEPSGGGGSVATAGCSRTRAYGGPSSCARIIEIEQC